jgi:hypothetical protein
MAMKLSDWASVAEILGAIAIVISLYFVGLQLSDGNNETRAATTQSVIDAEMTFQALVIQYADVWEEGVLGGAPLDPVSTRRAIGLYNMAMTLNDNRFQMAQSGYFEPSEGAMRQLVVLPFFDTWRNSPGAGSRSPDFLHYVDEIRNREVAE